MVEERLIRPLRVQPFILLNFYGYFVPVVNQILFLNINIKYGYAGNRDSYGSLNNICSDALMP